MLEQGDVFRVIADGSLNVLCSVDGDPIAVCLADGEERKVKKYDESKHAITFSDEDGSDWGTRKIEVATSVWYEPTASPVDDPHTRPYGVPFLYDVGDQELMLFISRMRVFTMDGRYMNWKMLYWPEVIKHGQWHALHAEF